METQSSSKKQITIKIYEKTVKEIDERRFIEIAKQKRNISRAEFIDTIAKEYLNGSQLLTK